MTREERATEMIMRCKNVFMLEIEVNAITTKSGITVVPDYVLGLVFGKKLLAYFEEVSRGSTRIAEGVYLCDVRKFINLL